MSVPVIGGRAGLAAFQNHGYTRNISTGGQTPNVSQAGGAGPPAVNSHIPAVSVNNPARESFSARLGSMAAAGAPQGSAAPPQRAGAGFPPDGGQASSFGSSLQSLLQSVLSGDMDGARNAVAALQEAITGPDTGPSNPWPVTHAASGPNTAPAFLAGAEPAAPAPAPAPAAAASPDDAQSAFKASLNSLLAAVQSGDAAASKTAASTLVFAIMAARQEGAEALPQREWGGQDSALRGKLASLLQSVQAGDMASARKAATAIQGALDAAKSQSASGVPAESTSASAPLAVPAAITASAPSAASPDQDGTFMSHLKGLLAAVQLGDLEAAQTAVASLFDGLTAEVGEFHNQTASLAPPPSPDGRGAGLGSMLSEYFRWS